jgi:hypothetical protein
MVSANPKNEKKQGHFGKAILYRSRVAVKGVLVA